MIFCCIVVALTTTRAQAADAPSGRYAAQLDAECADLVARAVRRGYGWGWDPACRTDPPNARRPTSRPADMQPLGTPAAALVLLWSGEFLQHPRYVEAAQQAARGVIAAQSESGKLPAISSFAPATAGGREEQVLVPDRGSTRASLGLWLAMLDANRATDDRTRGAALRAAHWLAKQQTKSGAFVSTWPPDATSRQAQTVERLIRLDTSDYRDGTLALLLAGDVLNDKPIAQAGRRAIDQLLGLQISNPQERGNGLWIGAYTLGGEPKPTLIGLRAGPDILASRYAMQTLLGAYLITGDRALGQPIDSSIKTLQVLRRVDLQWDRFPDHPDSDVVPSTAHVPATQSMFGGDPTTQPAVQPLINAGAYGLPELFHAVAQLKTIGRDRFVSMMTAQLSPRDQIAATLVGLQDEPFALDLPTSAADADAFLAARAELWRLTDGPPPDALADRVRRLWVLYLRARVEQLN